MLAPEPKGDWQSLGTLNGATRETKVEVRSRTAEDGSPVVELVEYSWGSGLGWYVQKRIALDGEQVQVLQSLLSTVAPAVETRQPVLSHPLAIREDNLIRLIFPA